MGRELSGRLRERVTLEQRTAGGDGAGGAADAWVAVATRWAAVEPADARPLSALAADTRQTMRLWQVTLRPGPAVTLDMRIGWRGLVLRIVGVGDSPLTPDRLVLLAEEQGG